MTMPAPCATSEGLGLPVLHEPPRIDEERLALGELLDRDDVKKNSSRITVVILTQTVP